ncbi:MAG: CTP synthase [Clostridiaceae bacterium]|jgi:CTP synthase|nr:CTP synthase [Clostridiaceae bacterium]
MKTKYIFVTGGVVSGLGKGITAAALGRLLKARGLNIRNQKLDPYINVDPSLMSPTQHGEIFITEDGAENDLDIGHYERFTDVNLTAESDITSGQVYLNVISRERAGEYGGGTVQVVPHVIDEIKDHIYKVGAVDDVDVVISEIGGTVGDVEGQPFLEAIRQVSYDVGRENCLFIHVTLLPYLKKPGEIKTKPTQHSVKELLSYGIQPDILVCRTEKVMTAEIRNKLARFCNVRFDSVIQNIDCASVYELPLVLEEEGLANVVCERLQIAQGVEPELGDWIRLLEMTRTKRLPIKIALVGKYTELHDAYYSVVEAMEHSAVDMGLEVKINWVESQLLEGVSDEEVARHLGSPSGIIIPGGFGPRGMEGMIRAAQYAREEKIPFFGIGLGMQMGVVEIARNLAGLANAHTDEAEIPCQDVFFFDNLTEEYRVKINEINFGDLPIVSGAREFDIEEGSLLHAVYGSYRASERHHHRREFNPAYMTPLASTGLRMSGINSESGRVAAVELPDHPFYVGTIFHPEFKSRPTRPHRLFHAFLESALKHSKGE